MSEPDVGLVDPTSVTLYTLYRQRIFQEYELINHRMMWMVLSQAFMLALWAGMPARLYGLRTTLAAEMVAIGGMVVTAACFYSIRAARSEIERHVVKFQAVDAASAFDPRLPSVVGEQRSHRLGHIAPECMMAFVMVLWLALLTLPVSWW